MKFLGNLLLVALLLPGSDCHHRLPNANDVIGFLRQLLNPQHHDYHRYIFRKREIDTFEDYDE
jgi:hypothetical protein